VVRTKELITGAHVAICGMASAVAPVLPCSLPASALASNARAEGYRGTVSDLRWHDVHAGPTQFDRLLAGYVERLNAVIQRWEDRCGSVS
jgi:hypothetical protein